MALCLSIKHPEYQTPKALFQYLGGNMKTLSEELQPVCDTLDLDYNNEKHREIAYDWVEDEDNVIYYMLNGYVPPHIDLYGYMGDVTMYVKDQILYPSENPLMPDNFVISEDNEHVKYLKQHFPDVELQWIFKSKPA